MNLARRVFLTGAGAAATPFAAFAHTRMAVPGGGHVLIPAPYDRKPAYPTYGERFEERMLVRYRNWRATLSGHPECDGLLVVGVSTGFNSLGEFVQTGRACLSIQWAHADRDLKGAWTQSERRYPIEEIEGEAGLELIQTLAVHRVGFFGVYDEPAQMYAVQHRVGLSIAIWIARKHGGLKGARRIATRLAGAYEA